MMTRALEHDGPALLEVRVSRQELAMPPTISLEQMTGFSLFMLKAVLSGRGDELIDLAKINLHRSSAESSQRALSAPHFAPITRDEERRIIGQRGTADGSMLSRKIRGLPVMAVLYS